MSVLRKDINISKHDCQRSKLKVSYQITSDNDANVSSPPVSANFTSDTDRSVRPDVNVTFTPQFNSSSHNTPQNAGVMSNRRSRPKSSTLRGRGVAGGRKKSLSIPNPRLSEEGKRLPRKKKHPRSKEDVSDDGCNRSEINGSESSPSKSPRFSEQCYVPFLDSSKDHNREAVAVPQNNEEFHTVIDTLQDVPSTVARGGSFSPLDEGGGNLMLPPATSGVDRDDVEEIPWAVTELEESTEDEDDGRFEQSRTRRSFLALAIKDEGDRENGGLDYNSSDPEVKFRASRQRQLREVAKVFMNEPDLYNDEDYDTDLEEDFPKEPEPRIDEAGISVYIQECKMEGIDPSPFVTAHLGGTSFVMRHRYLGLRALVPFARAMQKNTTIEYLDLSDNRLDRDGSSAIAEMMRDNCYVTRLDMSQNLMGTPGTAAFASMLGTNYTLKRLCLKANHLTDKDAQLLAEGLKNNVTLTDLDLSCNDFGEAAGVHLGKGLSHNDGLVYLDLAWNAIRAKGVLEIANALKVNSSLEVLDLSRNGIDLPGCQAVLRALKLNQGLRILDLSRNHITSEGARKLSIGLKKNSKLEALLLNGNRIGDVGLLALLKAVGTGKTGIKLLGLQDIPMPETIHNKCTEVQAKQDICILRLDVDGRRKFIPHSHVTVMVDQFIAQNSARFLSALFHLDEHKKRVMSSDDIIKVLIDLGLNMNQEELESSLHHVGALHREKIAYLPLLDGLAVLQDKTT